MKETWYVDLVTQDLWTLQLHFSSCNQIEGQLKVTVSELQQTTGNILEKVQDSDSYYRPVVRSPIRCNNQLHC